MNLIGHLLGSILPEHVVSGLGWTLVHSLWQGAAVALVFGLVMVMMRRHGSKARYAVGVSALVLMVAMSVFTFFSVMPDAPAGPAGQGGVVITSAGTSAAVEPAVQTGIAAASAEPGFMAGMTSFFSTYFNRHLPLIVTIWFLGMFAFMLKLCGGFLLNLRLKSHRTSPLSREWQNRFNALCRKARLTKPVRLAESAMVKVPMVIGHLKPVVLFPVGMVTGMPREQIEALMAHELAHIFRRDYMVNIFQGIIEVVFFYHPAVWWISSHVREEREHCCDDMTVSMSGDSMNFAKALTRVQERGLHLTEPALAVTGKNRGLLGRIKRLFNPPRRPSRTAERFTGAFIMIICLFTLFIGANAASRLSGDKDAVKRKPPKKAAAPPAVPAPAKPAVKVPAVPTKATAVPAPPVFPRKAKPAKAPAAAAKTAAVPTAPAKPDAAPVRVPAPAAAPSPTAKVTYPTSRFSGSATVATKSTKGKTKKYRLVIEDDGSIQLVVRDVTRLEVKNDKTGEIVWRLPPSKTGKKWSGLTVKKKIFFRKGDYSIFFNGSEIKITAHAVRVDAPGEKFGPTTFYIVPPESKAAQEEIEQEVFEKMERERTEILAEHEKEFKEAREKMEEKERELQAKAKDMKAKELEKAKRFLDRKRKELEKNMQMYLEKEERYVRELKAKEKAARHRSEKEEQELKIKLRDLEQKYKEKQKQFEKQHQKELQIYNTLVEEMKKDKLTGKRGVNFSLTADDLYIHGKKAPAKFFKKYKKLYEKLTGKKLTGDSRYTFKSD